jgi:hypothetical protein
MLGFKTGRLTVIAFSHKEKKQSFWKAQCECGNIRTISTGELNRGRFPVPSYCDNKKCVNPEHLYIGTPQDNSNDMVERGLIPCGPNKKKGSPGEKNVKAKLDTEKVKYIRYLCENGFKRSVMASFFHVHPETIARIARGQSWNS